VTGRTAGSSLVELLAGLAIGLLVTLAAVSAVAVALRHLVRFAVRAEADDIAALALEAFTLDVRRAGFDPRATGIDAVVEATAARLGLHADLDGDGAVDATSEEATTIACDVPGGRLSRILGSQSLPLASGVAACTLAYAGADGAVLLVPPGGLDAAARRRIRRVTLDLALVPPGLGARAASHGTAALRVLP
jgi:Tfp pilus assembly protein PilW